MEGVFDETGGPFSESLALGIVFGEFIDGTDEAVCLFRFDEETVSPCLMASLVLRGPMRRSGRPAEPGFDDRDTESFHIPRDMDIRLYEDIR